MVEQQVLVAHGDDVIVEYPGINGRRILLGKDHPCRLQPVQPGHRTGRLQGLAGRIAPGRGRPSVKGFAPIDEQFHTGLAMPRTQAGMIRRPLVPQLRNRW